jgi:hypothetical protein
MIKEEIPRGTCQLCQACFDTFNDFDTCHRRVTLKLPAQCEKYGLRGQNAYQQAFLWMVLFKWDKARIATQVS